MHLVFIHILLLFIHLMDGKDERDVFYVRHKVPAEVILQISDIPAYIGKLFLYGCPYLLFGMLSAFGKCQVVFPRSPAVAPGKRQAIGFTHAVYHAFQLFPRFVQHLRRDAFAEQHQGACIKRRCILVSGQTDEILVVRILCDLFHQFSVRELVSVLNNQGTECRTQHL